MNNILSEMYQKDPINIVQKIAEENKENKLSFFDIVTLGDYEKISEEMVSRVFRKLENEKSTTKLLEKVLNHTGITLNEELKTEALMYLEMRHLFIHNRGLADKEFVNKFKNLVPPDIKHGDKLQTNFPTISKAVKSVNNLCDSIDKELINGNLVLKRERKEKSTI